VQRSGWCPGRLLDCMPVPPNKFQYWAIVYDGHCYWKIVVCDATIWRHIHFCKPTFWRTHYAYNSTRTVHTSCCTIYHCNERNLSALQVRKPEQNAALKAITEQFTTAKISGHASKHGSRTHSALRQRSSELQKYVAAHQNCGVKHTHRYNRAVRNCKNTRLRECLVE